MVHFLRVNASLRSQSRYGTGRFHTLGRVLLTHCVSAVNSRSVSCVSAVFGPILELTQEIGPFWQPLPAGTAHSSPGTFCFKHMQAQTWVYTLAKKSGKHLHKAVFLDFLLFSSVFPLTWEIFSSKWTKEELFPGCFAVVQIPDRTETTVFQLYQSAGDLQQSLDLILDLFPFLKFPVSCTE